MGKIGLIYYITLKAEKNGRCIDLEEHDQYADFSSLATEDADAFTEIFLSKFSPLFLPMSRDAVSYSKDVCFIGEKNRYFMIENLSFLTDFSTKSAIKFKRQDFQVQFYPKESIFN